MGASILKWWSPPRWTPSRSHLRSRAGAIDVRARAARSTREYTRVSGAVLLNPSPALINLSVSTGSTIAVAAPAVLAGGSAANTANAFPPADAVGSRYAVATIRTITPRSPTGRRHSQ